MKKLEENSRRLASIICNVTQLVNQSQEETPTVSTANTATHIVGEKNTDYDYWFTLIFIMRREQST